MKTSTVCQSRGGSPVQIALRTILLFVFTLAFTTASLAQAPSDEDATVDGVINVKLNESAAQGLAMSKSGGITYTGIATVDQLNAQFQVAQMERVFRPAGKFESRHEAWGLNRWYRVRYDSDASPNDVATSYLNDPSVESASPVYTKELHGQRTVSDEDPALIPNDPDYGDQWHYNNTGQTGGTPDADVNLPEAHDINTGSPDVVISIVDSGLDLNHPEFQGMLWINEDEDINGNGVFDPFPADEGGDLDGVDNDNNGFVDDVVGYDHADNDPIPETVNPGIIDNSHGTHVAGTVAAKNGNGQFGAGVAGGDGSADSGARLMINQTFANNVGGFAEAVVYAADMGAVVSQNSWGYTTPGTFEQPVLDAIDYFRANAGGPSAPMNGGIYVNSSGNSNSDANYYPGFYPPSFAVTATEDTDTKASYSNYGEWVDIAAPGGEFGEDGVWSTVHTTQGGFESFSGTSMAAPHVSGAIAVVISENPGLTNDQVELLLQNSGEDISDLNPGFILGNRINIFNALQGDDTTPPAAITDLTIVSPNAGASVGLEWTAPGDDGNTGTATLYDLRYSTSGAITDSASFANATPVAGVPEPDTAGTTQSFVVTELPHDTEIWFAIKAFDDFANGSDVSNSPSTITGPAPVLSFTPDSFDATLEPNQQTTETLTVSNDGDPASTLDYRFPGFAAQELLQQPGIEENDVSPVGVDTEHAKGEDDLDGVGHPVLLGAGGPDEFGYNWIDSNEPGGPTFNWVDISDDGTELSITDDFGASPSVEVTLPFTFDYYGEEKTSVRVDNNGMLFFDGPSDNYFSNSEIPSTDDPNGILAAFWDDLDPDAGGAIYAYDDAANNRFIVQFDAVPAFFSGELFTFQFILYQDGTIRFQYLDMDASDIESATTGIESPDGEDGLQVAFNTAYVENDLAVEFAAIPDFIADVDPASGLLSGGESDDVTVTLSSQDIEPGIYENSLVLTSNDPDAETNSIPATLEVAGGTPDIAVDPTSIDFGAALVGASTTQTLTISNEGNANVDVTALSTDNDDFTLSSEGGFTIPFGESTTVDVTFTPSEVGPISGTLTVESTDPDESSIDVPLTGEGDPPPVIEVDPELLTSELIIGAQDDQTLTVSNTGQSTLDFTASLGSAPAPTELPSPEEVAAPAPDGAGSGDGSQFSTRGSAPSSAPAPTAAEDFVYTIDDGSAENALGLTDGGDIMWLNAFEVADGAGTITDLATTLGSPDGDNPAPGPVRFVLYEDPNDDGDPTDAEFLTETTVTIDDPGSGEFTVASIPPTEVEGVFFIAALYQDHSAASFPAPMDESSPSQGASWVVGETTPNSFNVQDLAANALAPTNLDEVGFPANWLLRADGTASFLTFSPSSGTLEPGESLDMNVTFDATGLSVGEYSSAISFDSNDPVNSPLDVPATLTVTSAPYPFALAPDMVDLIIDVNEDDDETETREVTVTNTTDQEQSFAVEVRGASGEGPDLAGMLGPIDRQQVAQIMQRQYQRVYPDGAETTLQPDPNAEPVQYPADVLAPLEAVGVTAHSASIGFASPLQGSFVNFDLGEPSEIAAIGGAPSTSIYAGDFALGDDGSYFAINADNNAFLEVDAETGATTQIGTSSPQAGETWTELATDPTDGTMYASTASSLYTIDPSTGEATLVGSYGLGSDIMIAIAVDDEGVMYGHEIAADVIYTINPETAEVTELGPTGVDANFAQGMDFDPVTGELYMAWYQGGGVGGLRVVDRSTGSSTLVGPFQGDELGYMAIPSQGFLFADPSVVAGTLAPNADVTFDVTVDATGLFAGTYNADLAFIADVPGQPEEAIPFTLTVEADAFASVDVDSVSFADTFANDTSSAQVTLTNTGRDVLDVSSISTSNGVFSVAPTGPLSLEPTESTTLDLLFVPTAAQSYSGTLNIESSDPNSPTTVVLEGEGTPAPAISADPASFDLQAYIGQQYERTLTISNTGGDTLDYSISEEVVSDPSTSSPDATFRQTLLDEDFNDGIPSDWTVADNEGSGVVWQLNTDYNDGNHTGGEGTAAAADSDEFGPAPFDTELWTPELTAEGSTDFTLSYVANYQNFASFDFLDVDISTDGGATWTNMLSWNEDHGGFRSTPGEEVSIDLAPYLDVGDTFIVRWRYYDPNSGDDWDWYAQVDDVVIQGPPAEYLTVNPTAGSVAPGESQDITLAIDANGLAAGTYEVNLNHTTNDPLNKSVTVPVTIDVIESLSAGLNPQIGDDGVVHPNETFSVPVEVESLDDLAVESYQFALSYPDSLFEATGITTEGTLSEGLTLATNITPGQIQVAAADGASTNSVSLFTIEGEGTMVIIEFQAKETLGTGEMTFDEMQFNEGDLPASAAGGSVEVAPLYGDATLNLDVTAFDAQQALEYVVGNVDLNEAAFEAADVTDNGSVSAFDSANIFDFVIGEIGCFPAVEDCNEESGAMATNSAQKQRTGESGNGVIAWGSPSDAPESATSAEIKITRVPLTLQQVGGTIRAVQLNTEIDASKVSVEGVSANLPDDWQMAYNVEDGMLKVAMAGGTPISATQELATIELHWLQPDAELTMAGEAVVNESAPQALAQAAVTTIPDKFALHGNYPNPFTQMTQIALDLPAKAEVQVEVYDILGRRVINMPATTMQPGQDRTIQLDASALASGMYLYRVVADMDGETQVDTGRMTLVR